MAQKQGFTRASSLGPIADFVEHQGGSIIKVFQFVDLPVRILDNPDVLIPLPEQFRILQSAARETGDQYFGARLGQHVRVEKLSAFGQWVSQASNLNEAIERANRGLNRFLQTGTELKLISTKTTTRWSIEFLDKGFEGRYHNELLGLSYLIEVVRLFEGRNWSPDLIRVTARTSIEASNLEQILKAPVIASQRVSSIEFSTALLSHEKLGKSNHSKPTRSPIESFLEVPSATNQYGAIAAITSIAMLEAYPKIDWVASKLGMTRRTMQRRLKEHGTTFSKMLDHIQFRRAEFLLRTTSAPIIEIAFDLGYHDPGHFSRAFRKWSGTSPTKFRQQSINVSTPDIKKEQSVKSALF